MKALFNKISKVAFQFFSAFYGDNKVLIFAAIATAIARYTTLITGVLKQLIESSNPWATPALVAFLAVFVALVNFGLKKLSNHGEKKLAEQGDTSTLNKLNESIQKKKALVASSK